MTQKTHAQYCFDDIGYVDTPVSTYSCVSDLSNLTMSYINKTKHQNKSK